MEWTGPQSHRGLILLGPFVYNGRVYVDATNPKPNFLVFALSYIYALQFEEGKKSHWTTFLWCLEAQNGSYFLFNTRVQTSVTRPIDWHLLIGKVLSLCDTILGGFKIKTDILFSFRMSKNNNTYKEYDLHCEYMLIAKPLTLEEEY